MSAGGAPGVSPPLASGEGSSRLWSSNERDLRWIGGYLYLRLPVSSTSTDLSTASRVFTGSSQASVGSIFSCKGERMAGQRGRRTTSFFKCQRGRRTTSLFFIGRWPGSSPGGGRVLHRAGDGGTGSSPAADGFFIGRRTGSASGGGRVLHRATDGFFTGRRTGSASGGGRVLQRASRSLHRTGVFS